MPTKKVNLPSWYWLVDNKASLVCTSLITMDKARMYRNPGGQSLNSSVCKENRIFKQDYHTKFHKTFSITHDNDNNNACAEITSETQASKVFVICGPTKEETGVWRMKDELWVEQMKDEGHKMKDEPWTWPREAQNEGLPWFQGYGIKKEAVKQGKWRMN